MFSFTKNVARSALSAKMAISKESFGSGFDLYRAVVDDLPEIKETALDVFKTAKDNVWDGIIKKAAENTAKALTTGKFVRSEDDMNAEFGDMFGGDFDMSSDFDSDGDMGESDSSSKRNVKIIAMKGGGNRSADPFLKAAAMMNTKATYATGKAMQSAQINANKFLRSIASYNKVTAETMLSEARANTTYRATTVDLMSNMLVQLQEINRAQQVQLGILGRDLTGAALNMASTLTSKYDKAFNEWGDFSPSGYAKTIASNIKNVLEDAEMMKEVFSAPLEIVTQEVMKKFMPKMMDTAFSRLGKVVGDLPAALAFMMEDWQRDSGSGAKSGFKRMFARVFGVSNTTSSWETRLGTYEKGAVPFDGVTRRAITEVIPKYLAMILNQLKNGKASDEMLYNYETGMFQSRGAIMKEYNRSRTGSMQDSEIGSDMKQQLLGRRTFKSSKDEEKFAEAINKVMSLMAIQSGNFRGTVAGTKSPLEKLIAAEIEQQWKQMGTSERTAIDRARQSARIRLEEGYGQLGGSGTEGSATRMALSSATSGKTKKELDLEMRMEQISRKLAMSKSTTTATLKLAADLRKAEMELSDLQRERALGFIDDDMEENYAGKNRGSKVRRSKESSSDFGTVKEGVAAWNSPEGKAEIERAANRSLAPLFSRITRSLSPSNLLKIIRNPIQSVSAGMDKITDQLGAWIYGKRDGGITPEDKKAGIMKTIKDKVTEAFLGKKGDGIAGENGKGGGIAGWFRFQFQRFTGSLKSLWAAFTNKLHGMWFGKDGKSGVGGLLKEQWTRVTTWFGKTTETVRNWADKTWKTFKDGLFGEGGFFGKGGFTDKEILSPIRDKFFLPLKDKLASIFGKDGPLFGKTGFFGSEGKLFGEGGVFHSGYSKLFGKGTGIFTKDGTGRSLGKGAVALKGAMVGGAIFGPIGAIAGGTVGTFMGEELFKPGGLFDKGKAKAAELFSKSIFARDGKERGWAKGGTAATGAAAGYMITGGPLGAIAGGIIGSLAGQELFKPGGLFDKHYQPIKEKFLNTLKSSWLGRDGKDRGMVKGGTALMGAAAGYGMFGPFGAILGSVAGGYLGQQFFKAGGLFDKRGIVMQKFNDKVWEPFKNWTKSYYESFTKKIITPSIKFLQDKIWNPFKETMQKDWERVKVWTSDNLIKPMKGVLAPFRVEMQYQFTRFKTWMKEDVLGTARKAAGDLFKKFSSASDAMFNKLFGVTLTKALDRFKEATGNLLGRIIKMPFNFVRNVSGRLKKRHEGMGLTENGEYLKGTDLTDVIAGRIAVNKAGLDVDNDTLQTNSIIHGNLVRFEKAREEESINNRIVAKNVQKLTDMGVTVDKAGRIKYKGKFVSEAQLEILLKGGSLTRRTSKNGKSTTVESNPTASVTTSPATASLPPGVTSDKSGRLRYKGKFISPSQLAALQQGGSLVSSPSGGVLGTTKDKGKDDLSGGGLGAILSPTPPGGGGSKDYSGNIIPPFNPNASNRGSSASVSGSGLGSSSDSSNKSSIASASPGAGFAAMVRSASTIERIEDFMKYNLSGVSRNVNNIAKHLGVKDLGESGSGSYRGWLGNTWDKLKGGVTKRVKGVRDFIRKPYDFIRDTITTVTDRILSVPKAILENGWKVIKGVFSTIGKAGKAVKDTVVAIGKTGKYLIENVGPIIGSALRGIGRGLSKVAGSLYDGAAEIVSSVWKAAKFIGPDLWEATKEVVSTAWTVTKKVIGGAFSALGKTAWALVSNLDKVVIGIAKVVAGLGKAAWWMGKQAVRGTRAVGRFVRRGFGWGGGSDGGAGSLSDVRIVDVLRGAYHSAVPVKIVGQSKPLQIDDGTSTLSIPSGPSDDGDSGGSSLSSGSFMSQARKRVNEATAKAKNRAQELLVRYSEKTSTTLKAWFGHSKGLWKSLIGWLPVIGGLISTAAGWVGSIFTAMTGVKVANLLTKIPGAGKLLPKLTGLFPSFRGGSTSPINLGRPSGPSFDGEDLEDLADALSGSGPASSSGGRTAARGTGRFARMRSSVGSKLGRFRGTGRFARVGSKLGRFGKVFAKGGKLGRLGSFGRLAGKAIGKSGSLLGKAGGFMGGMGLKGVSKLGGRIPVLGSLISGGVSLASGEGISTAAGHAVGTGIGTAIGAGIGSIIPGAGTLVGGLLGGIVGDWIGAKLGPMVGGILSKAGSVISKTGSAVWSAAKGAMGLIGKGFVNSAKLAGKFITKGITGVAMDAAKTAIGWLGGTKIGQSVKGSIANITAKLQDRLMGENGLFGPNGKLFGENGIFSENGWMARSFKGITGALSGAWGKAKDLAGSAIDVVKNAPANISNAASGAWESGKQKVMNSSLFNTAADAGEAISNAGSTAYNAVKSAGSWIAGKVQGGVPSLGWIAKTLKREFSRRGFVATKAEAFARGAVAQLVQEIGWESKKTVGTNNFFNIKSLGKTTGDLPPVYAHDRRENSYHPYASWSTPEKGIAGYVDFLMNNPRYAKAGVFDANTPEEYGSALQRAGFATDPSYAKKIASIANSKKLNELIAKEGGFADTVVPETNASTASLDSQGTVGAATEAKPSLGSSLGSKIMGFFGKSPTKNEVQGNASATPELKGGKIFPIASGIITSLFGPRNLGLAGASKDHKGIDIGAPMGTPILAAMSGTVSFAGRQNGYGNAMYLNHADGSQTVYGHMRSFNAKAGEVVQAGQKIAEVGNTGVSSGPHLHFEYRQNGQRVNPESLLGPLTKGAKVGASGSPASGGGYPGAASAPGGDSGSSASFTPPSPLQTAGGMESAAGVQGTTGPGMNQSNLATGSVDILNVLMQIEQNTRRSADSMDTLGTKLEGSAGSVGSSGGPNPFAAGSSQQANAKAKAARPTYEPTMPNGSVGQVPPLVRQMAYG